MLKTPELVLLLETHPRQLVLNAVREILERLRKDILDERCEGMSHEELVSSIQGSLAEKQERRLKRVINGTGIIVHTNLGRSNLSRKAIEAVVEVASSYSNLEYELKQGTRGNRYSHVEGLLCELLGCEAALVVNNNAAAVLLILSALGMGKEAIVSRGELVEIGGSFRVPDVMQQGGCILREVGATNRTHLRDYEQAVNENSGLLLRVHPSNYRVVGFTKNVPLEELKALAVKSGLPLVEDMGSGLLIELGDYGLGDEPTVQQSLTAGVDVLSFSGDKLLGGPQSGIIVGRKRYIELMKTHPLARALRVDKMTLAALEVTLGHYRDADEAKREIETLRKIAMSANDLQSLAGNLRKQLQDASIPTEIVSITSQVGGGALPTQELPSCGVAVELSSFSPSTIARNLRHGNPPIVGRIVKGHYLLDVRTLEVEEFPLIVRQLSAMVERTGP
ncbi:MAG: L-seryl-tRNA(Sec) selenium transferase [bacterium]|nr:L-seryl-tRNA(Sec) selenium transferase [bacterium]